MSRGIMKKHTLIEDACCEDKAQSQLEGEIDVLVNLVSTLGHNLTELERRLEPVLTPCPTTNEEKSAPCESLVTRAEEVRRIRWTVRDLNLLTESILENLEV